MENMQNNKQKVKITLVLFWLFNSQGQCSSKANSLPRSRNGALQKLWLPRSQGRCSSTAPSRARGGVLEEQLSGRSSSRARGGAPQEQELGAAPARKALIT